MTEIILTILVCLSISSLVLGSANSHDPCNLPILRPGGGFKHGQHTAFDTQDNTPLGNLNVTMLQRLGVESNSFGSSAGTLTGPEGLSMTVQH